MSALGRAIGVILALGWAAAGFAAPFERPRVALGSRCEPDADSFSTRCGRLRGPHKGTKYTYDERGNRTAKDVLGGTAGDATYLYDLEDRLLSEERDGGATSIAYAYANRGDMTSKTVTAGGAPETHTYVTDYLARITAYTNPGGPVSTYIYAPTGDRIAKHAGGEAPDEWSLPSDGDTIADYTKLGTDPEEFTGIYVSPGIDGRLARIDAAGAATYTFGDALQSVHQVTNASGVVVRTQFTDAWGNNLEIGMPKLPTGPGDRYGFQGRESDNEFGLQHFRARSYDPMTGRFTSRDPVPYPNLYNFVANDPVNMTDPSGADVRFKSPGAWSEEEKTGAIKALEKWIGRGLELTTGSDRIERLKWRTTSAGVVPESTPIDAGSLPAEFRTEITSAKGTVYVEDVIKRVWEKNPSQWPQLRQLLAEQGVEYFERRHLSELEVAFVEGLEWELEKDASQAEFLLTIFDALDPLNWQDSPPGHPMQASIPIRKAAKSASWMRRLVKKPIWFPSAKKVLIDLEHILSGHTASGARAVQSGMKDLFPHFWSKRRIEAAMREAFGTAQIIRKQKNSERYFLEGVLKDGSRVEMWYDHAGRIISSAWWHPK